MLRRAPVPAAHAAVPRQRPTMKPGAARFGRRAWGGGHGAESGAVRALLLASILVTVAVGAPVPAQTADDSGLHDAGHGGGDERSDTPPVPPVTEADRAAAFPDLDASQAEHELLEDPFNSFVLFDQLEGRDADSGELLAWQTSAWIGRSLNRFWIRSEGERHDGDTEHAELELLWGRGVARWWDVLVGGRRDFEPGSDRDWAAFGVQGLAPYRFEIDATGYLGEGGRTAARVEAEYELLITNRLILQPRLELNWYGKDDVERGIASGLSSGEAALRLRYELRRELAPYIGLVRERKFAGTAELARAAGNDSRQTRWVAGLRVWF